VFIQFTGKLFFMKSHLCRRFAFNELHLSTYELWIAAFEEAIYEVHTGLCMLDNLIPHMLRQLKLRLLIPLSSN